jgi:hypothetical protein
MADFGSGQCCLHQTGIAAGDVEKAEGRFEAVVQGRSKDMPDFAVSQDTTFDQLTVSAPLFLKLGQRGGVHDGTAGLKLVNMDVYQAAASSPKQVEPQGNAVRGKSEFGSIFICAGRRPPRGGVFAIEIVVPA